MSSLWWKIYGIKLSSTALNRTNNNKNAIAISTSVERHINYTCGSKYHHSLKKASTNLGNNVAHSKYAGFNGRALGGFYIRFQTLHSYSVYQTPFDRDHHRSRQSCPMIIILSVPNMFTLIRIEGLSYEVRPSGKDCPRHLMIHTHITQRSCGISLALIKFRLYNEINKFDKTCLLCHNNASHEMKKFEQEFETEDSLCYIAIEMNNVRVVECACKSIKSVNET
uniref:Uncharacterized protein n=1 Tax=Glossina pallidipes TaxID=7398 RepID=A0A1A9ZUC7_GLOPL